MDLIETLEGFVMLLVFAFAARVGHLNNAVFRPIYVCEWEYVGQLTNDACQCVYRWWTAERTLMAAAMGIILVLLAYLVTREK